jgi:hemerythrin superfamily protein
MNHLEVAEEGSIFPKVSEKAARSNLDHLEEGSRMKLS